MAVVLPPNSTGQTVDTITTVAGKERQVTARPSGGQFSIFHTPAAATQATISQAAGAAGVSNVATALSFAIYTGATAQTIITVSLRDGATGAGTVKWSKSVALPANSFWSENVTLPDIVGTAATAMTVEFSAAGVANSVQSVCLMGYTTAQFCFID